jgi:hypothetical protein
MNRASSIRVWFYGALSAIGFVTAMVFNGLSMMNGEDYGKAWFGSAVDWVLSADLIVVAIAAVIFMIAESSRIGMKRAWVYIMVSCFTAMAFSFPLFLAFRERHLARQHLGVNPTRQPMPPKSGDI